MYVVKVKRENTTVFAFKVCKLQRNYSFNSFNKRRDNPKN